MLTVESVLEIPCELGESPRWDEKEQCLYFVDITGQKLHRYYPETNTHSFRSFNEPVACVAVSKDGGLVIAMQSGIYFIKNFDASLEMIVESPELSLQTNRFNDGRCDAKGRLLIGTIYPPKDRGGANLYSLDPKTSKLTRIQDDLMTSNGVAFSPDNKYMFLSDTPRHIIYRYDYAIEDGSVCNKKDYVFFPKGKGRPDGASVDSQGLYWSALFEGSRIVGIDRRGTIVHTINTPCKSPTMAAFGGKDYKTLFITCVGEGQMSGLFSCKMQIAGIKENRYG